MTSRKDQSSASERIHHAFWAGLTALGLALSTLLLPLDQLNWTIQARLAQFDASGDIVFVGSNADLTDESHPQRRIELARTLDRLREAGVDQVYLEMSFSAPSTPEADTRLNAALRAFNGKAALVQYVSHGINGELEMAENIPAIARGVPIVTSHRWRNIFGFTWYMPFAVEAEGQVWPTLPSLLAGSDQRDGSFVINYGFDLGSIPSIRLRDISTTNGPLGSRRTKRTDLDGKILVIGNYNRLEAGEYNIPGQVEVAPAMIDIYAAETLKAGYTRTLDGYLVMLAALALLALATQVYKRSVRYVTYAAICAALPATLYYAAKIGLPTSIVSATVMLTLFAGLRARAKWRANYRLVDPDTGLPTFAALEADKDVAITVPAIIVARIHRFEEVRKSLPGELHVQYVMRIADRLRAARKDATIYLGQGHMLAWTFPEKEPALIREHLEGLRALFASPLLVGDTPVDVGITFGVDITPSPNVERRLAAATDAAERTTETYEPIAIAELASDEDLIWNISIQARIDNALANGEIYTIYQPKVLVRSGEMVGLEALVRWRDPVKGLIPPDHFIRQCENTGRMAHLTRHVMMLACRDAAQLAAQGTTLPVAVNISATLVHEREIVRMVREVLDETRLDPQLLTLEITETYRISNHERAAEILGELRTLGPRIAMDDFGVGAASLEALQKLPFNEIKIDRMFTSAIKDDPKAAAIVRSVLQLGRDLRIAVVAEGVEDEATLSRLREFGCEVAQGFGIARPVPIEEIPISTRNYSYFRQSNMV